MNDDLPEILRKIRVLKNYSQEYLAEQIGVSLSSYARYEAGKVEIDFYSVLKIARLYKMSLDELVHYGDPNFKAEDIKAEYLRRSKVSVLVELDGLDETLDQWVKKLKAINKVL